MWIGRKSFESIVESAKPVTDLTIPGVTEPMRICIIDFIIEFPVTIDLPVIDNCIPENGINFFLLSFSLLLQYFSKI